MRAAWAVVALLLGLAPTRSDAEPPTFLAFYDRLAPENGKSLACIINGSAHRVVTIHRISVQVSVFKPLGHIDIAVHRIGNPVGGVPVTINPRDTTDGVSAGVVAISGATDVLGPRLGRITMAAIEALQSSPVSTAWERAPGAKGIVLHQGEGLAVIQISGAASVPITIEIEFTEEIGA